MKVYDLISLLKSHFFVEASFLSDNFDFEKEVELTSDSNNVHSNSIFFAISGPNRDGHDFLDQVLKAKPVLVVLSYFPKSLFKKQDFNFIQIDKTNHAFERCVAYSKNRPDQFMNIVGVTGTNGKTSITYMLEQVMTKLIGATGVIGTNNHRLGNQIWETNNSTPGPKELYERLDVFRLLKAKNVAIEITSHGLDQGRVESLSINSAIFTNLTQDHLDYHGTITKYFAAKEKLFNQLLLKSEKNNKVAIVNGDDRYGKKIKPVQGCYFLTFGQKKYNDIQFKVLKSDVSGTKIKITHPWGKSFLLEFPMPGVHNAYNLAAVYAWAGSQGISSVDFKNAIAHFPGVPGRLQRVVEVKEKIVFIDYAHTPDGVDKTLSTIRNLLKGKNKKLITVFGCGGDRDRTKRPIMGQLAEKWSDVVFVTSDNPRTEDPDKIILDILKGMKSKKSRFVFSDRAIAIHKAIELAKPGDVVAILGKGHETYQIIGTKTVPFDDYKEAMECLKNN